MNKNTPFVIWIVALAIELIMLYDLINRVHDQDEVLFYMTIIAVTLVVGTVMNLRSGNNRKT
ncbi:hypothetical protein [Cohnella soli]|uniref:Uncharacterized protein n=1 Tax=Cohnella soli TaxID=425005 RepID=A0ABW0HXA3_9BACL